MTRALTDAELKAFNDAVAPVLADLRRLVPMVSAGAAARRAGPGAVTDERGQPGLDAVEAVRKAGDLRLKLADLEARLRQDFGLFGDDPHSLVKALDLQAAGRLGHGRSPAGCAAPASIGTAGAGVKPAPARRRTAHPDEAA